MLTPQDVAVDSHTTQFNIVIHVKHSKKLSLRGRRMVASGCNRSTAVSSGSTSGLFSSLATITGSSVSVPGWYNPIEIEVNRFPTPGASGGWSGLVAL